MISFNNATLLSTDPSIALTNITGTDNGGRYLLIVSNDAGFEVVVRNIYVHPQILSQPEDVLTEFNSNASLSVLVDGSPYPSIQWQKLSESGAYEDIPGENETSLRFQSVAFNNQGVYRCIASITANNQTYTDTSREAAIVG